MSEHIILTAEEAEKRAVDLHEPTKRRVVRRDELKDEADLSGKDIKGRG